MKRIILLLLVLSLSISMAFLAQAQADSGAVFAMTNPHLEANEIVVYHRAADGLLTLVGTVATGGDGYVIEPDDALGAQGPLILSRDNRWLFAVNAGSNEISVFQVNANNGLTLVDVIPSGGDFPVSLTIHQNLLYVLNSGGFGNITGFTLDTNGHLTPLAGSTRSLNNPGVPSQPSGLDFLNTPAQVGFNPLGDKLVVTVKGALSQEPKIHVFAVNGNGLPSAQPTTTMTNVPFGFAFDDLKNLIVAEPFGEDPPSPEAAGAVSSYRIAADGSLDPISRTVPNGQPATCWIAITTNTRFAYTSNNGPSTISSYKVNPDGSLMVIKEVATSSGEGSAPVDLAITPNNRFLYNVNSGRGTVSMFKIDQMNGDLISLGEIRGLPDTGSAVGIAVR